MKSITVLLLAGLAVAAKEGGAQVAAGNATDIQQGNSTANAEAGQDNNNNNNNNDAENNAGNASDLIQVQNGQQCINVEALNGQKCVSHRSPKAILCYIKLTRSSTASTPRSLTYRT